MPHATEFRGGVRHGSSKAPRGKDLEIAQPVACQSHMYDIGGLSSVKEIIRQLFHLAPWKSLSRYIYPVVQLV
jgi:hypothetical protein